MNPGLRYTLYSCGFLAVLAVAFVVLLPSIGNLNANRLNLRILEARVLALKAVSVEVCAPYGNLFVKSQEEFFAAMSGLKEAASRLGLYDMSFASMSSSSISYGVAETVFRLQLTGSAERAEDFMFFLTEVHNIRFAFLYGGLMTSLEAWIVMFHEEGP